MKLLRDGRGRVTARLGRLRYLVGVLAAVGERADAAGLRGVGSAEAREATPQGDGDGVRRGGGHDAGADEQRADGHGPAVAFSRGAASATCSTTNGPNTAPTKPRTATAASIAADAHATA